MNGFSMAFIQLPLVRETCGEAVRMPEDIWRICADIGGLAQESFHVLALNGKNRLLSRYMVSLGLVDASLVHPREVFRTAISHNASAVALAHNHPSGDPSPSAEDVRITRQMIQAGKILDIAVMDHVIIGRANGLQKGFLSMREAGLCDFGKA